MTVYSEAFSITHLLPQCMLARTKGPAFRVRGLPEPTTGNASKPLRISARAAAARAAAARDNTATGLILRHLISGRLATTVSTATWTWPWPLPVRSSSVRCR